MKDFITGFCAVVELIGFIVLVGIYGGIDQDGISISDGVFYVIIVSAVMAAAGLVLWFNRDEEVFYD